jgi:hypothetical protein
MPGRKPGEATPEQKAALAAGRAKAHATTRKKAAARATRKATQPDLKSRHQQLLDGELAVAELDEEELKRFRGRDIDGEFKGRTAPLPPRIHAAIRQRLLNTMQTAIEGFLPRAISILEDVAENSPTDAARVKAVDILLQRGAGKVPDIVRVGAEDPWDAILGDVLREDGLESDEYARLKAGLKDMAGSREGDDL